MAAPGYDLSEQLADEDAPFINDLEEYLCRVVDDYRHSDTSPNPALREHTKRHIRAGSSHRRPRITLAFGTGLGSDYDESQQVRVAAQPQLLHDASLILDDVGDDAQERRGRDSFWYGLVADDGLDETTAKNMAAVHAVRLTSLPARIVNRWDAGDDIPDGRGSDRREMIGVLNTALSRICAGQQIDYHADREVADATRGGPRTDTTDAADVYDELTDLKTGALIVAPAELGAIMADAPRMPTRRWAREVGRMYQMQDDVADTPDIDGKGYGTDLVQGRPTILWQTAMERDESGRIAEIWRRKPEDVAASDIEEAWELAKETGSVDAVVTGIADRKAAADTWLDELDWERSESRTYLEELTGELVRRAERAAKA